MPYGMPAENIKNMFAPGMLFKYSTSISARRETPIYTFHIS